MFTVPTVRITRPSVIIDEQRARSNIERMWLKARASGVQLRPHFKTHRSAAIGNWFRDYGVRSITVSSVEMAEYFHTHGWNDITLAFVVNLRELDRIATLAARIDLNVITDTPDSVDALESALPDKGKVSVWIKIDPGYHRTGISWSDPEKITRLTTRIQQSTKLEFAGILSHNGAIYRARSRKDVRDIHTTFMNGMRELKANLESCGIDDCAVSIGDTPGCSVAEQFIGIDEIRPGNFVFHDLQQWSMGVCLDTDLAMALACPVVGVYPERHQVTVYGGAVHLSREHAFDSAGTPRFGHLMTGGHETLGCLDSDSTVVSLSQEHGIVSMPLKKLESISPGDVLLIAPIHSCLTCHQYSTYYTVTGKTLSAM